MCILLFFTYYLIMHLQLFSNEIHLHSYIHLHLHSTENHLKMNFLTLKRLHTLHGSMI